MFRVWAFFYGFWAERVRGAGGTQVSSPVSRCGGQCPREGLEGASCSIICGFCLFLMDSLAFESRDRGLASAAACQYLPFVRRRSVRPLYRDGISVVQ